MDYLNRIFDFYKLKSNKLKVSFNRQPEFKIYYYFLDNSKGDETFIKYHYEDCYNKVVNLVNNPKCRHVHVMVPEYHGTERFGMDRRIHKIEEITDKVTFALDCVRSTVPICETYFKFKSTKEMPFNETLIGVYNILQSSEGVEIDNRLRHIYGNYTGKDSHNIPKYIKQSAPSTKYKISSKGIETFKFVDLQLRMMYFPYVTMGKPTIRFAYIPTVEEFENAELSY